MLQHLRARRRSGTSRPAKSNPTTRLGAEAVAYAQEIVNRATRRLGEMLAEDPGFGRGRKSVTVTDLDISHNQSKRAQQLAKLPEAEFEAAIAKPQNRLLRAARDAATNQARQQADPTPVRTAEIRIEHVQWH